MEKVMNYKHIAPCIKILAATFLLTAAAFSRANTTVLVGGGSTVPASSFLGASNGASQITSPATGTLFKVLESVSGISGISYCLNGINASADVFYNNPGDVQVQCNPIGPGDSGGMGAASVGRSDLSQPNFMASALELTSHEYIAYMQSHTESYPVQIPVLASAVGVAFNKMDDQGVMLTANNIDLADAQLCGIFSGEITSWNDPALTSALTLQPGHTISGPINVQYDVYNSDATFGLSFHLTYACSNSSGKHFFTNTSLANVVRNYLPTLPVNWVGSIGNAGIIDAIKKTPGSFGVIEVGNSLQAGIQMARINGKSPISDFGNPISLPAGAFVYNVVYNGSDPSTGKDVYASISSISKNPPPTQCVGFVEPAGYTTTSSVYPLMEVIYIMANSGHNGADLAATRKLLDALYNPSVISSSSLTAIGPGTGHALINTGLTVDQIDACLIN